jgi:glycosyltransferase involved in cell wall biosynthesis
VGRGSVSLGASDVVLGADAFAPGPRRYGAGSAGIIAVGTQEQSYKGHDVLIRAVRQMLDDGLEVHATIVGGGRTHEDLRLLVASLDLEEHVTLAGAVNERRRVIDLLDAATVFAIPSRSEGLPRALVEAMARGLPAVGSAVGGIPELLDPEWVVPPDDHRALATALGDLLGSPARWEEQSRRNLDTARGFRVDDLRERFDGWLTDVPIAAARRRRSEATRSRR